MSWRRTPATQGTAAGLSDGEGRRDREAREEEGARGRRSKGEMGIEDDPSGTSGWRRRGEREEGWIEREEVGLGLGRVGRLGCWDLVGRPG